MICFNSFSISAPLCNLNKVPDTVIYVKGAFFNAEQKLGLAGDIYNLIRSFRHASFVRKKCPAASSIIL